MTTDHTPGTTGTTRTAGADRASGTDRTTGTTGAGHADHAAAPLGPPEMDRPELRADIERTRENIGASGRRPGAEPGSATDAEGKVADVRDRLQGTAGQAREKVSAQARQAVQVAKTKTHDVAESPRTPTPARGGAVLAVSAGAVLAAVVLRRRRRARQLTTWQRTVRAAQETGTQARELWPEWRDLVQDRASGLSSAVSATVRDSDSAAQAAIHGRAAAQRVAAQARQAAAAPDAAPRAQGAATATLVLILLGRVRKVRRNRRDRKAARKLTGARVG